MDKTDNFIHNKDIHNLESPNIIVPFLVRKLNPQSIVDVGCGIGTFLHIFKKQGVAVIKGYDGDWVDREKLYNYIDEKEFVPVDLEKLIVPEKKYDLAISLEVAEHISENSADTFVKTLTNFSDVIVFSAAVPGQIGQGHVNEQWPDYWSEKFNKYGYDFYDVLRPVFWGESEIAPWYKQNIFLILKKNRKEIVKKFSTNEKSNILRIIHPEEHKAKVNTMLKFQKKYIKVDNELKSIEKGKKSNLFYIKLFIKSILFRLNMI